MLKAYLLIAIVLVFGFFILYNRKFLNYLGNVLTKSEKTFYVVLGKRMKHWNVQMNRTASIKKGSLVYKIDMYFKDIITNIGLAKDNVTPIGLLSFITSLSLGFSIFFILWSGEFLLSIPAFFVIFYFLVVLFRFVSLMRFEKKEAEIMDAEDLIAMDIKGGVYNAIVRYRNSFHPSMRPYFDEFIENIRNRGYGFKDSMMLLNEKLGSTFTDFAQKAIMYEDKADDTMDNIFSSIIELNRYRRDLRYENNKKFNKLRLEFLVSIGVITAYGVFSVYTDSFLANFFTETLLGKLIILIDIVIVTAVLAYLASIKAKFL